MEERGIIEINLVSDNNPYLDGTSLVYGKTTYTTSDHTRFAAADVAFLALPLGIKTIDSEQNIYDLLLGNDYIVRLVGESNEPSADVAAVSLSIDLASEELNAIFSGAGDDTLTAETSAVSVLVNGGAGSDRIFGGEDNDILFGGSDNDRIAGKGGDDVIVGDDGADHLFGDDGNDVILFDAADLAEGSIQGGLGKDIAIYTDEGTSLALSLASHGLEALFAGAGNDRITGSNKKFYLDLT